MSGSNPSHRPLLPAAMTQDALGKSQGPGRERNKQTTKRTQITSIACVPCQIRKSKCDGGRPVCQACILKGRPNCHYDFEGDNRRTSALKSRLADMQQGLNRMQQDAIELRNVVHTLGCHPNALEAQALARHFEATEHVKTSWGTTESPVNNWNGLASHDESFDFDASKTSPVYPVSPGSLRSGPTSARFPGVGVSYGYTMVDRSEAAPPTPISPDIGGHWTFYPDVNHVMDANPMTRVLSISDGMSSPSPVSHQTSDGRLSRNGYGTPQVLEMSRFACQDASSGQNQRYWFSPPKRSACLEYYGEHLYHLTRGSHAQPATNLVGLSLPIHSMLPLEEMDPGPLSRSYTDFRHEKRRLIKQGCTPKDVLGSSLVDVESVLRATEVNGSRSLASWAARIVMATDGMAVAEKLAMMLMHTRMMRWLIHPTVDAFDRLPFCMIPTPLQLCVAHPAWIDFVPWPEIRDAFIAHPEAMNGIDRLRSLTTHTSVDWPHSVAEMTVLDPMTNEMLLSPSFERYIEDINNWSLDPSVLAHFPILHGRAWFREPNGVHSWSFSNADPYNSADFAF